MGKLRQIKKDLRAAGDHKRAVESLRFFKTGKGEYGEGDRFLGLKVGDMRSIAKRYRDLSFADLAKLLDSAWHEERSTALMILVDRYGKGDDKERGEIYRFYLKNIRAVNNWDLVDTTAPHIVGTHLVGRSRSILYRFAGSRDLWKRRIAILATFTFVRRDDFDDTFRISDILLEDKQDLIHKAVGWMLREVGNRSMVAEEKFLKTRYKRMPRTMLRYAIEKFPEKKRKAYLEGRI
jgi:3-methyladenine DNA glycosylase AlkD